jgi:cytochrome P450 family 138
MPRNGLPPGPPVPNAVQGLVAGLSLLASSLGLPGIPALRSPVPGVHRLRERYGDMFTVSLPGLGRAVVVADPALIKQVFAADEETLHFGEGSPFGSTLGPHSLLAIDGAEHTEHRKLLMPPLHGERMGAYESIVEEETIREIESWPDGREIRTLEPFMRITLNAIIRAVFGADGERYGSLADEMRSTMPKMIAIGARLGALPFLQRDLGPWSPWGQFLRQRKRFEWGINTLIDDARRDPRIEERDDVLALLARARHESDRSAMSDEEIHDELATMLAAGHETTATTLAWGVERLRRHPELVERLAREADDGGRELRVATIHELQRVRPVVPGTGRLVVKPFRLGDYVIPPGHGILISATLTHEDPRLFPNPHTFDADRFLGKRPDPFAWVPFGGGRRRCPGAAFAHMEMDVVLRTILTRLELEPTREADEAWAFRGVTFAPGKGGRAVFKRRPRPERPMRKAAPLRAAA